MIPLGYCENCRAVVPASMATCPHCGGPVRSVGTGVLWVIILLALAVMAAVALCGCAMGGV